MLIATQANSRTTEACKTNMSRGLEVSFASGAVMVSQRQPPALHACCGVLTRCWGALQGNAVVGLGLLGLSVLYIIFTRTSGSTNAETATPTYVVS
jgi:Na+/H+-translocating membrane pyrophosphatase